MQEAIAGGSHREPPLSEQMLGTLSELNGRFLELVCAQALAPRQPSNLSLPPDVSSRLIGLNQANRTAVARCPYALFDLRFHDDAHWHLCLQNSEKWRVAESGGEDVRTSEFIRLALFYCWHLAITSPHSAPLIFGMSEHTVLALRNMTLDRIPGLIAPQCQNLTLRWSHCKSYWRALTGAAQAPNSADFRRAQLFGLQIAAVVRLSN